MLDLIPQLQRWVSARWDKSSVFMRMVYLAAGVAIVGALLTFVPQTQQLDGMFAKLPDSIKGSVFIALFTGFVVFVLYGFNRATRALQLKTENESLKSDLGLVQAEVKQHDERVAHLLDVESRVKLWQKECKIVHPPFVPASQRKTRFITVLNLKGGVGKTTLSANLAACLALGDKPLRILLMDVDFQGTLGVATVDRPFRELQERNGHFVERLLLSDAIDDQLLPKLRIGMMGAPNAEVVLAADSLDLVDFELQARFFLNPSNDPRYRLLTHLHRPVVTDRYDLVLFDCPPRVTASVVNALLCSDHVLIPTRLDGGSINAVPRTINWVKRFGPLCPATVLGVVATNVALRDGKLTKADQLSYDTLRDEVKSSCGADVLFTEVVRATPAALNPKEGTVASTASTGREVFSKFVAEFRRRVPI